MNAFRVETAALRSLLLNLAFCFYTGWLGLSGRSWWFVTLAAYYTTLSITRFAVLLSQKRTKDGAVTDRFIMRFTGILFLFLAVVLAGTTYLAFYDDQGVRHHEIVMITMAVYAFWKLTLGVVQLIRNKRVDSLIIKTLRNISFADGLVTIFSLQRSMLVSFGEMSRENIALFNALTGSGVYLIIFFMGINLIGGKRVTMAKSKFIEANEKLAETVADGYKKIEKGVVAGYKKIESGVVEGYSMLEDKFIDQFLTQEGETLEDAKKRLKGKEE